MDLTPRPRVLTTESGAPVADNQHSASAGPTGPLLIQDQQLLEKLARFNRERIPERVVHARGAGAYGYFEVTADVTGYTRAAFLSEPGKRTEVVARFSAVTSSLGSADATRDIRGIAARFYTEEGNYDMVGNNTPIFFIRDPMKFPDLIHSQKRDPYTGTVEPENIFDFLAHTPEATHQVTWLYGDRGIPAGYRHMDIYGSHAFGWENAEGTRFWVKYHFKSDQGIENLSTEQARRVAGEQPDSHQQDLLKAIEAGDFPSWTLYVQVMPEADADGYRFNPFDLTKVWPHEDYPLIEVGRLVLDRNPDDVFTEIEQVACNPANFVPGIGPSPDKMLQGRLFAYADAHRYRLGVNNMQLGVNRPRGTTADNYGRDGFMRADAPGPNRGRERDRNYEPNSFGGPVQTDRPLVGGGEVAGRVGSHATPTHREDDDYRQAGDLYRLMSQEERDRLAANLAAPLAAIDRADIVERFIGHLRAADGEYGERVERAVAAARG